MRPRNWHRMAERHNAAVEAKTPLFVSAGLITPLTPNDIKECYEPWQGESEKLRLRQVRLPSVAGVWFRGVFRNPNWMIWMHAALDYLPRANTARTSGAEFSRGFAVARINDGCPRQNQEKRTC